MYELTYKLRSQSPEGDPRNPNVGGNLMVDQGFIGSQSPEEGFQNSDRMTAFSASNLSRRLNPPKGISVQFTNEGKSSKLKAWKSG